MSSRIGRFLVALWLIATLLTIPHPSMVARAATNCSDVVTTGIPQAECEALIALYTSTNGPLWENGGWNITNMPCRWYGVTCDGGHVTEIDLYENGLSGSIPPELGNLTNLTSLQLSREPLSLNDNHLSGSIPTELGKLTNLRFLDLSSHQLSGNIPPELSNLQNLETLDLSANALQGTIPSQLGKLTRLITLSLSFNQLNGSIPTELGKLANLTDLSLGFNQLSGSVPAELGDLVALETLFLGGNELSGNIPPELGTLTNLTYLSLWTNQLTGNIPPELGTLINLTHLLLDDNRLSGSIPPELGTLTNLEMLSLKNNQLSGDIPPELGNLIKLTTIDLSSNHLTGKPPAELVNLINIPPPVLGMYDVYPALDLRHNHLITTSLDPALDAFLLQKNPGWQETQTAPTEEPTPEPTPEPPVGIQPELSASIACQASFRKRLVVCTIGFGNAADSHLASADGTAENVQLVVTLPHSATYNPAESGMIWNQASMNTYTTTVGDLVPGVSRSTVFGADLDETLPEGSELTMGVDIRSGIGDIIMGNGDSTTVIVTDPYDPEEPHKTHTVYLPMMLRR